MSQLSSASSSYHLTDSLSLSSGSMDRHAPVHSPVTQSPYSTDDEDGCGEQQACDEASEEDEAPKLQTVAQLAEQIYSLQTKIERLQALQLKFHEHSCFDDDDAALVQKELRGTELKLEAMKASIHQRDLVYLHVTLKRREAFLESAVRQQHLNPDKDHALFHALVKKQVYLTRLAHNRVSSQQ